MTTNANADAKANADADANANANADANAVMELCSKAGTETLPKPNPEEPSVVPAGPVALVGPAETTTETLASFVANIVKSLLGQKEKWHGRLIETMHQDQLLHIELGRAMVYPVKTVDMPDMDTFRQLILEGKISSPDTIAPIALTLQVTIRDIYLPNGLRRQGLLALLVQGLLRQVQCVRLESVQPAWMEQRLAASPLWIKQSLHENGDWARFRRADDETTPFSLF